MKKAGIGLQMAAVMNAILLVVGFLGCQSGAFNWLSEKGELSDPTPKAAVTAPTQESPPTAVKSEPVFIGGTKSPFPPSLQGLVTGLTPAGDSQPSQPDAKEKEVAPGSVWTSPPAETPKAPPTFMPSSKAIILPGTFGPPESKKDGTTPPAVGNPITPP